MIRLVGLLLLFQMAPLYSQDWKYSLEDALAEAKTVDKNVLLFFTVPDACDACVNLEHRVLKSDEFLTYANQNYILARIEFRNSPGYTLTAEAKAKNLLIVEKYNKDGFFPLVVLLSNQERVLGKVGVYNNESPSQYIGMLQSVQN